MQWSSGNPRKLSTKKGKLGDWKVELISHKYNETRHYAVQANNEQQAFIIAVTLDRDKYGDKFWRFSDNEGDFEIS